MFAFVSGNRDEVRALVESGGLPWWSSPELRLAFFRPLTGLTHWLDFRLWPAQPWLMHVQSLLWFGLTVAAAAILYRRLLQPTWIAGLAGLLFAVDDAHGFPAMWLANRNATLGTLFGLLCLLAHDRWRRDRWKPGLWVAPACLLTGLCSGEIALGAVAFLVAYAVTLEPSRGRGRVFSLVPMLVVLLSWTALYWSGGFGAAHSGLYVDPVASPIRFLEAVVSRGPFLLFGQLALPSTLAMLLSRSAATALWVLAVTLVLGLLVLCRRLLQRDPRARFLAFGMVLALVPACATFPDDRLLFLAGFGGTGLVALVLAGVWERADWLPAGTVSRRTLRGVAAAAVVLHLVLAPLGLAASAARLASFDRVMDRAASSLPADPRVATQTVVVVTTPSAFVASYAPLIQLLKGRTIASSGVVLGSGIHATTVHRPAAEVLVVRPEAGFLAPPGTPSGAHGESPSADPRYFYQALDLLYRDSTPFPLGWSVRLAGVTLEVTALTADGRPAELTCRFSTELEHPSLRWLRWDDGAWVPFELPAVGATVVLPEVTIPL